MRRTGPPRRGDRGELSTLVTQLREERAISQEQLAAEVGCDRETIARVEQDRGGWGRRTAKSVFDAIFAYLPIEKTKALRFLELTGLSPDLYQHTHDLYAINKGPRPVDDAIRQFAQTAAPLLTDIAQAVGAELAMAMLKGCWIAATTIRDAKAGIDSPAPEVFTHRTPPKFVKALGATETIETDYTKPAQPQQAKRRRAQ